MEPQNESNEKSGIDQVKETSPSANVGYVGTTNVETNDLPIEPFTESDPFRASRIDQTISETTTLLQSVSQQDSNIEDVDVDTIKALHQDASERSKWSKTRTDGYTGLLRLAVPTPPRSKRVL